MPSTSSSTSNVRVEENAVVHVAEVGSFDNSFGCYLRRVVQIRRNAVILGEMIERPAGEDRQLRVLTRHECRGRRDGAVSPSDKDSFRTTGNRALEVSPQLIGLRLLSLNTGLDEGIARLVSVAAGGIEERLRFRGRTTGVGSWRCCH